MTTAATCAIGEISSSPSFYRGEQYDSDLGLYYLRARYYNPATGRFLSRDPEDGNKLDPASLHKYLYADGDPMNGWDPTGRTDSIDESLLHSWARSAEEGLHVVAKFVAKYYTCIGFALADVAFMTGKGDWITDVGGIILWFRCLALWPMVPTAG